MNINQEDYHKERIDSLKDKMSEDMFCTMCGDTPKTYMPDWTGSENWFEGYCDKCEKERGFVYSPMHGGDNI